MLTFGDLQGVKWKIGALALMLTYLDWLQKMQIFREMQLGIEKGLAQMPLL